MDLPEKYKKGLFWILNRGWTSTVILVAMSLFLVVGSQSPYYITGPLWLTPFLILQTDKSNHFALHLFSKIEPIYRVQSIIRFVISKMDSLLFLAFICTFIYLAYGYLSEHYGEPSFPDDIWHLLLKIMLGIFCALLLASLICLPILPVFVLTYTIILMIISSSIKATSVIFILFSDFTYTLSNAYENFRRTVLEDGLVPEVELFAGVGLKYPQYKTEAFLDSVKNSAKMIVSSFDLKDYRVALFAECLGFIFSLGCLFCLIAPSLIPRICVKIASFPLAIILIQRKVFISKASAKKFVQEVANNNVGLVISLCILGFHLIIYYCTYFEFHASLLEIQKSILQLHENLFSNGFFNYSVSVAIIAISSFVIANAPCALQKRISISFQAKILRFLGFVQIIGIALALFFVMTSRASINLLNWVF